jgi:hypothetical protein
VDFSSSERQKSALQKIYFLFLIVIMRPHLFLFTLQGFNIISLINAFGGGTNSFPFTVWTRRAPSHPLPLWNNRQPTNVSSNKNDATTRSRMVALVAEPDGGEELTAIKSIEGARMKNMGVADDANGKDGPAYNFWMTAKVSGKSISEFRAQISKEASKKANFPGFRKVSTFVSHFS